MTLDLTGRSFSAVPWRLTSQHSPSAACHVKAQIDRSNDVAPMPRPMSLAPCLTSALTALQFCSPSHKSGPSPTRALWRCAVTNTSHRRRSQMSDRAPLRNDSACAHINHQASQNVTSGLKSGSTSTAHSNRSLRAAQGRHATGGLAARRVRAAWTAGATRGSSWCRSSATTPPLQHRGG